MSDVEKGRTYGSGSGTTLAYAVEARTTRCQPIIYNENFVLDQKWRLLPVNVIPDGFKTTSYHVPTKNWCPTADHLGLMNHQAAKALAELFLAVCQAHLLTGALCIECRLIGVEVTYSYSTKENSVSPIINRTDGPRETWTARETTPIALSAREEKA